LNLFQALKSNKCIPPFQTEKGNFVVDDSLGISLLTALSYKENKKPYLIVTSNLYKAQKIYSLIKSFLPEENILLFPSDELVRAETLAASKEMVSNRIFTLNSILENKVDILVANLASCTRFLPDPKLFKEKTLKIKVGDTLDIEKIKKTLILSGYLRVNKIDQSLQFAVRGDILDVFSVNNDNPTRIEFYGDEIESIREFDLGSQTSLKKVNEIEILPATECLLSEQEIDKAMEKALEILDKDKNHLSVDTFTLLRDTTVDDLTSIIEGIPSIKNYKYFSLLSSSKYSIFDYCKNFTKIFVDVSSIEQSNDLLINESLNYLADMHETGKIISHLEMYQDIRNIVNVSQCITTSSFLNNYKDLSFALKPVPYQANKETDSINIIRSYLNEGFKIVVCLGSKEHLNSLQEQLENLSIKYEAVTDFNLPKCDVGITVLNLSNGFVLPEDKIVYLTSAELFNEKIKVTRFDSKFKQGTILKSYEDLQPGDYVVHEYQGIGQFLELQTLEIDGVHKDFLKIAYHGGEFFYVPLAQFQLVRKYMGKEGISPRLSRLHSKDWENTKKKIKERINDLAERLMRLYVERTKVKGFAFNKDDVFQEQFDGNFEHELTHDQQRALEEIKSDMEKDSPMDRLLCGDVGFGKTEVAFRAAFKAINSGKQVAMLCPTTLLARQHYELALQRFAGFGIKIAIFSRLIPEKRQKEYIKEIEEGKIHFAIGTHRLLSKEIHFKDIGLLIVDEEQRFGVEQKEKLKELKSNVDVLTLSATPIPRTLQISLLGVRSMSIINTAPQERMPIQTYVSPFRMEVVKELIEREMGRGGQVFYMHNNVETLYLCAARLSKLLPGVTIGVAHGKMNKDEIEDVMMKFYQGDISVLVCTSIIENGIDVPNANMIIVEDSENYGLSQLYQIKGRVGRSDKIAYAYLFYSENKVLKDAAKKRLKAIQDFTELGSGYKIAQRDLMIRGAGDILGPEQAGFIDSIGLDMYIKLLNEAVKEKLDGVPTEEVGYDLHNVSLSLDAYIPKDYANDSDKIELYQDILSAPDIETLAAIKVKTRDIYGKLPNEVEQLFVKRNIDLLKEDALLDSISEKSNYIEIMLGKNYINIRGIGNILFEALMPYLKVLKVSYANNMFKMIIYKRDNWIYDLENILKSLVNLQKTHKIKDAICD